MASGDPFVGSGWCCGICYDVNALLQRGRPLDDVVDYCRIDAAALAARARSHGHLGLAARLHPPTAATALAPAQPTLPGVA